MVLSHHHVPLISSNFLSPKLFIIRTEYISFMLCMCLYVNVRYFARSYFLDLRMKRLLVVSVLYGSRLF